MFLQDKNELYNYGRWYLYDPTLNKYDWSSSNWSEVTGFTDTKKQYSQSEYAAGLKGDRYYVWDMITGVMLTAQTNGKLTKLDINTNENVDIIDMKNKPSGKECQIVISNNESIFFYDKDTSSIRVIKER